MPVIVNPGFELGSGQTATGWTYSETANYGSGASNCKRGDWSSWLVGLSQVGSYGFVLGKTTGDVGDNIPLVAGDYCQIAQSVDFDRVFRFTLNLKWGTVIQTSPDRFQFQILVGNTEVFEISDTDASSQSVYEDQLIDTADFVGTNSLIFRLTSLEDGTYFPPGIFIDKIVEQLLPGPITLTSPANNSVGVAL